MSFFQDQLCMGIISADWICSISNLAICSPHLATVTKFQVQWLEQDEVWYGLPCCSTYKLSVRARLLRAAKTLRQLRKPPNPRKVVTTIILFSLHGVGYTITVAQYSSDDHSGWVEKDTASEVKENNDPRCYCSAYLQIVFVLERFQSIYISH